MTAYSINIHPKICQVLKYGSGDTDERWCYKAYYTYATFVWTLRWKLWKGKMTAYPMLIFMQCFIKFQNMDLEIQMKDDVIKHIYTYATFVWTLRWKSWKGKMMVYPILLSFMQCFIKFQRKIPEIWMKRAKCVLDYCHYIF